LLLLALASIVLLVFLLSIRQWTLFILFMG